MRLRFVTLAAAALAGLVAIPLTERDAYAHHDDETRLIDHTAHTLRGGEIRLGLWQFDFGIWKQLNVGTDTAPYVASIFLKRFIPNAHAKVNVYRSPAFTLSGEARFYYVSAGAEGAEAALLLVPLTAYASTDLTHDMSLHFEVSYTTLSAAADARAQSLDAKGAVAVQSLQFGTMLEYRLTRVTALTFRERYQPWFSPAVIRSSVERDANTSASVAGNLEPRYNGGRLAVIGGVAFSWKNINLSLGVGYGSLFVPSLGVVLPGKSILPDGSFDVRF